MVGRLRCVCVVMLTGSSVDFHGIFHRCKIASTLEYGENGCSGRD